MGDLEGASGVDLKRGRNALEDYIHLLSLDRLYSHRSRPRCVTLLLCDGGRTCEDAPAAGLLFRCRETLEDGAAAELLFRCREALEDGGLDH